MKISDRAFLATAVLTGLAATAFFSPAPAAALTQGNGQGQGQGGGLVKDVTVVNGPGTPVPVAGHVVVSGSTSVSGAVSATQSGPWTMRIDPAHNQVTLPATPLFFHDTGLGVINDGATVELGPFNLSQLSGLRFLGRAVNGDVHVEVIAEADFGGLRLDQFTITGESTSTTRTFVYDYPPPSVILRLTESGPGGANYHILLIGR